MGTTSNEMKPIIYTFHHQFNDGEGGGTGMTKEADQILLDTWREEWKRAGWIPRVLTMEDARQHPHFLTLNLMLDGLPFRTYDVSVCISSLSLCLLISCFCQRLLLLLLSFVQRLCFIRWLAMANQPVGGFMSDYDTFPLAWSTHSLPHGGRLTIHESSRTGGVPSLVSGSQDEWFRFAWAIVENAKLHANDGHWSDMKAMQEIYQQTNQEAYAMDKNVLPALGVLHGKGYDDETCDRASRKRAIHFSHFSVDKGVTPPGTGGADTRAPIAKEWLDGWRKNCKVLSAPQFDEDAVDHMHGVEPLTLKNPLDPRGDRPVIFTFYDPIDEQDHTGMTAQDDQKLIESWSQTWHEVGWDPRVLSSEVAKQHPDFQAFHAMLQGLPFRKFDTACFYRWLAMAVVKGGWLSDYDTFPLGRVQWNGNGNPEFLPHDGALTVHEKSKNGGVPSLVSGNGDEWYRLAKAQAENARSHSAQSHWSDMKAMQDLFQQSDGKFYLMTENVVMGDAMLRTKSIDRDLCKWLQAKYAVHFSHYSMHRSGRFKDGFEGARNRARVGREWILEYRQTCAIYSTNS